MFARILTTLTGIVLIVYGVLAAISPLPAGVILAIVGALMIAAANPAARPIIRRFRKKWRWFDRLVHVAGQKGPKSIRAVAEETHPGNNEANDNGGADDQRGKP